MSLAWLVALFIAMMTSKENIGGAAATCKPVRAKAVVWDLDGTLLDTETLSSRALQQVLDPFDKQEDWDLKKKLLGRRAPEWCNIVIEEFGLEQVITADEIQRSWENHLKVLCPLVTKCKGAEAITALLDRDANIPQAIATSSRTESVNIKRKTHEPMFARMQHIVCGDQVSIGKPHPEIYLLAASKLGVDPVECIAVEDSSAGVESAVAAGMFCIAVVDCRFTDEEIEDQFRGKGAGAVVPSLEDVRYVMEGRGLFER